MSTFSENFGPVWPPKTNVPDFTEHFRLIQKNKETELGYANILFNSLMEQVRTFETTLNKDEEIAAYLSSFGAQILVQIEEISFLDPYLIVFKGLNTANGKPVRLVQHTSQLSVLLTAFPRKPAETRPVRRIGFHPQQ